MTAVSLQNTCKSYDGVSDVVADVTLEMRAGEITALLGPSGCGKTTLLKMIAGLLQPDRGDICFNGRSILTIPAEKRSAVMVFQNHLLFPTMNVADNIGFGLKMQGQPRAFIQKRVADMLELVHLPGYEKRRPRELSGGQQQRVALARALILEPEVLLLDEPLSNLDAHLRDEMRDLILSIQRRLNITTVFVTHDQEEAVILADQIALIFEGRLQQVGRPQDFYERPSNPPIARFFGGVNFLCGNKCGRQIQTGVGDFYITSNCMGDGAVTATVRPENIRLCLEAAHNSIPGRIISHVYAGTYVRYKVDVGTAVSHLEVISPPDALNTFQDGQSVYVCLPQDKIWLMRAAEKTIKS